jgi:hypothetical protein
MPLDSLTQGCVNITLTKNILMFSKFILGIPFLFQKLAFGTQSLAYACQKDTHTLVFWFRTVFSFKRACLEEAHNKI